jgi:UDP-2-acetamido-2-deoxy-ribo-hexuluronate aminotransferase
VRFIDLHAQQRRIRKTVEDRIGEVLDHGQYVMGPEVYALEERLALYTGVKHAVSCASGTDALLMALMAHEVGPGDAVFTSPFTFVATAEVISLLRAVPVFVDIDPVSFNMDPEHLERAVLAVKNGDPSLHPLPMWTSNDTLMPRGVIAVDLFGLPADYDRINAIAGTHGLFVVEDAAQSFGGAQRGGKACSLAQIGCTSFFPAKPLGCYGDGGMCFTWDDGLAAAMRSIRVHGGGADKYDNVRVGINGRLDTLQAAILLAKFEIFPDELESRGRVAQLYGDLIGRANPHLAIPRVPEGYTSAWAQYSLLAKDEEKRSLILTRLGEAGIPAAVYYPKPLHLQKAFSPLGYREGDFPVSEACARRIFSLPMHPYLSEAEQRAVVGQLLSAGDH